jgi:serpin B
MQQPVARPTTPMMQTLPDQVSIRFGSRPMGALMPQSLVNDAVTTSSIDFSNKMLTTLAADATSKTTVISPSNTFLLLNLLQAGATADTAQEIRNAMNLGGIFQKGADKDMVVKGIGNYISEMTQLMKDTGITLEQAYGIWAAPGRSWNSDFTRRVNDLKGESATLTGADQINNWAASKTNDKIKTVVTEDEVADAACVLASATYLLSNWRTQFDPESTTKATFKGKQGDTTVDMMSVNDNFKASMWDDTVPYKAVSLPYGKESASGNELSMTVFVPKEGETLESTYNHLFAEGGFAAGLTKLQNGYAPKLTVNMPKFITETETDTKKVLQKMGINRMFNEQAQFDEMMDGIHIGVMKQKAFIDVNEKGTEAAAVDVAVGLECAMMPLELNVDKPFVSVIHDNKGRMLFVTTVTDLPEAK